MSPERQFAINVVDRLTSAGFTALWAGGCVRDELLGSVPKDYDVATDARPEQVRDLFGHRRTLAIGESFGVIVVLGPKSAGQVEVATFRSDGEYLDGRRPESVQFCSAEEDARRRDFTINGMFYDPLTQAVIDYVGGQADLKTGIVRAIGRPQNRMEEDKLRMLRAVRFAATFDFELDALTGDAIRSMADQITVVSPERIGQELRRMLAHPNRAAAVQLCRDLCLLTQVIPELDDIAGDADLWKIVLGMLDQLDQAAASPVTFPLAFAALLAPLVAHRELNGQEADHLTADIGQRLRLSNREIDHAVWLLRHRDSLSDASRLSAAKLKRVLAQTHAGDLLCLMSVSETSRGQNPADSAFCDEYLLQTPMSELNPPPLISGGDLIRSGLTPGPQFKDILETVRDAQLNGEISTPEDAAQLAATLAGSS